MYDVGQILFLVSTKTAKIVPARITAVTITKTLADEVTSHKLEFIDVPGREASLEDLPVEVFTKIGELQKFMISNATAAIKEQILDVKNKVSVWDNAGSKENEPSNGKSVSNVISTEGEMPSSVTVVLEDGVKANVILPPELG